MKGFNKLQMFVYDNHQVTLLKKEIKLFENHLFLVKSWAPGGHHV